MQSLDSSCQEADFIINDTLKKLKGSNASSVNSNVSLTTNEHGSSGVLLHQHQNQQQQAFVYQAQHQSQQEYQSLEPPLHTIIQSAQLSSPSPVSSATSVSVTFSSNKSSLFDCNISHIPAKPPNCIFDDDDSPTESTAEMAEMGNIVVLSDTAASAVNVSPTFCPSSTTTLSNFNSITSPSPVVPDLLLSTPPGVNSSSAGGSSSNVHTTNAIANFSTQVNSQQPQPTIILQQQQIQSTNSNKKAEKRPSSSSSSSSSYYHQQHSYHMLPSTASSPVSSPSKRQKNKELSTSSRKTASPSTLVRNLAPTSSSSGATKRENSGNAFSASSGKFFNFNEKIKELYFQLLTKDLNYFVETGLKQRTRSFLLERLVEREDLNTIVVNLYPGNKGYSLALPYDEHQILNQQTNEWNTVEGFNYVASNTLESGLANVQTVQQKGISSRNKLPSDSESVKPKSKPAEANDAEHSVIESKISEHNLVEVLRWPYENDLLLQCLDREVLPDFLMDMLSAASVTLNHTQDGSEYPRIHTKPNVFYAGCVIAQIRDFRQTFATSTNICDTKHILLRPTNGTIFADVQQLSHSTASIEDKLVLESQLVLASAEPLCLDPDPNIGRLAINAQHQRQIFNSHELRRQMKKYTQISINRKRKLDQFTHHYGLELCDYLTRLRSRPRSANNNANTTPATAPSNNPLVGATLSSFTSKVPRRPRDVIRPIRPPRLEYPVSLKVPENVINVEKQAKSLERLNEFTDSCKEGCHQNCRHNFQPQLIEEYVLETEREDIEGRRVIYHIKLSIFQRPSDSEYLGELYVDRDYREGLRSGESCRFTLGTRVQANRYIQQFREIFTEEGRKAVKITHLVPGHLPTVTHTGLTPEQRKVWLLQQQQQRNAHFSVQQQQSQQQNVVLTGCSGPQQQQILPATVHHVANTTNNNYQSGLLQQSTASLLTNKNLSVVSNATNSTIAVQQILRQQQQQHYIDSNGGTIQMQQHSLSNNGVRMHQQQQQQQQQQQIQTTPQHIQLQQIGVAGNVPGSNVSGSSTHQLSLSNGSLVVVQQHTVSTQSQQLQQQHQAHQQQTASLHSGITIQPASIQQQQKAQINAASSGSSTLRAQLSTNVPILQAQLKAASIQTTQQQLLQKQQQNTANNNHSSGASLHPNPAINAIVTSIMNSANQWQQQNCNSAGNSNTPTGINTSVISNSNNTSTALKNSSNASILSLLNSAPAAMTSTPVASGTFTSSTGQQQTVTLVQHSTHQQPATTSEGTVYAQTQRTNINSQAMIAQRKQQSSEVLQNLLNSNRKINIVGSSGATIRTNSAGNLIAVNLNQQQPNQNQQHSDLPQTVRVSMSALASQLSSPPAIMTNSATGNYGSYTVSTSGISGSVKILNTNAQQQQRILSGSVRRDGSNSTSAGPPPNAIVVGMAAPSPGSDSNASNASGFAVPQATSSAPNSANLNALLGNSATPSPSGSDHSQSSSNQNQSLLERLTNASSNVTAVTIPNMSPQQQTTTQQQFISKTLVHSPATSSIHSPMSSPHPQPAASPHTQQSQATTTLNLQGINISTLQGAMANFPGLQNVQVQIPGFTQPISLQFSGNNIQAAVQQPQQQIAQQTGVTNVSMLPVANNGNGVNNNSSMVQNTQIQPQQQQRSLLVSVPVSSTASPINQQQQQQQQSHTITLQTAQQQPSLTTTGTIVSLPSGAGQTVVLTNSVPNTSGVNSNVSTGQSGTTTMLTLPIAQLVGAGVQKLNSHPIRTSGVGGGVAGASNVILQQHQQQQNQPGSSLTNNAAIQLVGAIQQRPRNIQVVGTKQLPANRQLITTQRQIGGSTLKIATATSINAPASSVNSVISTGGNISTTPIVMSAQKVQLKAIKATSQQQQPQHRILNQTTASAASQTTPQQIQQPTQPQQQQQTPPQQMPPQTQHIQITSRATATASTINQRSLTAAKQHQQHQVQAAVNRRRSTTDAASK